MIWPEEIWQKRESIVDITLYKPTVNQHLRTGWTQVHRKDWHMWWNKNTDLVLVYYIKKKYY